MFSLSSNHSWMSYQVRSRSCGGGTRGGQRRRPDLITAAWWKEERGSRVFIDFNQNAPHKTIFGAWSVRARTGAQVSTPIRLGRASKHRPGRSDHSDGAGGPSRAR